MDKLYTQAEIARQLNLPTSTVSYYYQRFGDYIPTIGQGRHKRYTQEAVEVIDFISKSFAANLPAEEIYTALDARWGRPVEVEAFTPEMPQQSAAIIQKIIQDAVHEALAEQYEALSQQSKSLAEQSATLERLEKDLQTTKTLLEERNRVDNQEEKQRRVTDFITQTRVLSMLEADAIEEWSKLPRSARGGLFREDNAKKEAFVRKYVNERMEERIQTEYGIKRSDEID